MKGRRVCMAIAMTTFAMTPVASSGQFLPDTVIRTDGGVRFQLELLLTGVEVPSAMAFLPNGQLLLAERAAGRLSIVSVESKQVTRIEGLPTMHRYLDAGLHDVIVSPDFENDHLVYFSWSVGDSLASALEVSRARLEGHRLTDVQRLFRAREPQDTSYHYGGRLLLVGDDLYITVGEHHHRRYAQDLSSDLGKVVRIHADGTVPDDNPFVSRPGALPEIWTLGHRNPQGMTMDPSTGDIWINEHGPWGGDELNLIKKGANYGWPVVTWGLEYNGQPVGEGRTHMEGMEQPAFVFEASTAPSDMFFYTGDAFPQWKGSLFNGSMGRERRLDRIVLEGHRVIFEERLLSDLRLRVRTIEQGPDGFIYVGVDQGMLFRIRPPM